MVVINITFNQQVDKKAIFLLIGCYCINPKLCLDEKYMTNANDYPENFHKMIWGTIVNIAKKGNVKQITPLDIENEISCVKNAFSLWKNNNGWGYIESAIKLASDKLFNVGQYFDDVRKYSILRNARKELNIDTSFIYDETNENSISEFNNMTSNDVLNKINNKFLEFKSLWKNAFDDNYSFKAGDGIRDRLKKHESQEEAMGYPFQSEYLTTIFRGMKPKKYILRSSISGGSKTRSAIADACNISCDKIYDWEEKKWKLKGIKQPVLFISTELSKEEVQDCLLAHISGIEEDRIKDWANITKEEKEILDLSATYVEESLLYCEYMPDFNIDLISTTIEKYIIDLNIIACFFDYINDSPSLYSYYYEKTKTKLRTDQILFMFSNSLKVLCNKYNIYMASSTQLNNAYKEDSNKDADALKGSRAIAEKTVTNRL